MDDDINDSAPLLAHAAPDPRFGIPQTSSAMSMRPGQAVRFQLEDNGRGYGGESDIAAQNQNGFGNGNGNGYGGGGYGGGRGGEDEDETMVHYGPVPTRVMRRNRTQKRVA